MGRKSGPSPSMGPVTVRFMSHCALLALIVAAPACKRAAARAAGADRIDTAEAAYPMRLTDDLGRTVTIAQEPKSIVSLLPSHTETLFAVGVGERVVGVDDFSDDPREVEHLPRLGGMYDVQVERIALLHPDLVVASEAPNAVGPLLGSGLTLWAGSPRTFDDVYRVVDAIGRMVGKSKEAGELNSRIRKELAGTEQLVAGTPRRTVYYELDPTPYSVGPGSFIGTLLTRAGGTNIVPASLGDFPKISAEVVISADPDIVLGVSPEELRARPGWGELRALAEGHVYAMTAQERKWIARPGPRIAESLRILVGYLHPEVKR